MGTYAESHLASQQLSRCCSQAGGRQQDHKVSQREEGRPTSFRSLLRQQVHGVSKSYNWCRRLGDASWLSLSLCKARFPELRENQHSVNSPDFFQFAELWLTSNLRQLKIPFLTFKCRWHHCWRSATSGHWAKNIYQLEKYFYDRLVMKQQSLLCIFMKTSQS